MRTRIPLVLLGIALAGCPGDPPGDGFLLVTLRMVDISGTDAADVQSIQAHVTRIDVVHRPDCASDDGERVLTVFTEPQVVELTTEAPNVPRVIARVPVPPGCVDQVRIITDDLTVVRAGITIDGRVPSGPQTGIKINPADGEEPFPIVAGETTGIRVDYDPNATLVFNRPQGVLHHPTLTAVRIDPEFAFGILLDEVVLTFDPSATDGEIAGAVSSCGGVIQAQYPREFVTIRLPTSDLLRDAINCYSGQSGVRVALPNMLVELQGPNPFIGMPDDPQYDQGPPDEFLSLNMQGIRAPEAWTVTTGTPAVVVAVVDSGFDVLHEELLDNIWINPSEIPADVRARFVDQDGDGIITFPELNAPANDGLCPRGNSDPFDRCDPLDLVNGNCPGGACVGGYGWQDGADGVMAGEANGQIDDIIGWDFQSNDNLPQPQSERAPDHGTGTASLAVGRGNNGVAGLGIAWNARVMTISANVISNPAGTSLSSSIPARLTRDSVVRGARYALENGARVVSLSLGAFIVRESAEDDTCTTGATGDIGTARGVRFVANDKYDAGLQRLATEWEMEVGALQDRAVMTVAMGNCQGTPMNVDAEGHFFWPAFTRARPEHGVTFVHSTMIVVSNSIYHDINPGLPTSGMALFAPRMHPDTPFATLTAQITAPGAGYRLPDARAYPVVGVGTGVTDCAPAGAFGFCAGTSFSTPIVAGTAALVFSNDLSLTALEVRQRILDSAARDPLRITKVEEGRLLDAAAALGL